MYTFWGGNLVVFIVASHINWAHLIKERICSNRSKFFPLRVGPIFRRLRPPGKQTGSHENCPPLKTWRKKAGGVPIHLNNLYYHKMEHFGFTM